MSVSSPIIALVGSDGSGKTTVGTELLAWMRESRPTEMCHLGKQTGNWGRAIAKLPLIGQKMDRSVLHTTRKARKEKEIHFPQAVIIFALSMRRVIRFRRMLQLHRQGLCILTDRYPQTAVPGPMDGPSLTFSRRNSSIVQALAMVEFGLYGWMASYVPDLVIRLNVDLETAVKRKPDHRVESLERKVADVPKLSFNGAPILDIDATQPLDTVLAQAKAGIENVFHQYDARSAETPAAC
ncbi:nucleoside triphosphate hydrolase [Acetobacter estunensis]|uniref:nucleoside triphosphate hydrolase n=1 Tax=Acetobacter estunensis TaxID=104097 RepID=UPI0020C30244|nr:nucleoside triphosphate hydrolase [Acetobacter estunensis]